MSNDKKTSISVNAPVQGANVIIGSEQNIAGSVTISIGDMTQTIQKGTGAVSDKEALQKLVDELKASLTSVPAEQAKDAQKIATRVEELVTEVSAEDVDKEGVEVKVNLLKKAAENVKDALPVVLGITTNIVAHVLKMAGN